MRLSIPFSFHIKMFLALFLCLNAPFIATWYSLTYISQKAFYDQKGIYLMGLAKVLDFRLGEGGYDGILKTAGAEDASKKEKIAILNEELRRSSDVIAASSPGIGAGYYSRELDVILTYGPSEQYEKNVGNPISPEHPGREVMRTGVEKISRGTLVRGNILNAQYPIIRNKKCIGYVWVNEAITDIEIELIKTSRHIFAVLTIIYIALLVFVVLIFYRTITIERKAAFLAQSANNSQKNFLAHMSHEIRTPLNGVIGIAGLLKRTELNDKQREYTELLTLSANHLLTLINDILDFSKIEAGKLEIEHIEFNLLETINTVTKILIPKAMEKSIDLHYELADEIPAFVIGDPVRIRQILMNFMNNALKFTETGSIRLVVSIEKNKDRKHTAGKVWICFSVIDTGIGISEDRLHKLFASFSQGDASSARKYGGTGLGLVISKELVTIMGGEVGVESEEGAGSAFWCLIPFFVPERTEGNGQQSDTESSSVDSLNVDFRSLGTILVAEDNPINQIVVSEILSQAGFVFEIVADGQQALNAFIKKKYALILMDCQMPVMDGFEATKHIREKEREDAAGTDSDVPPIPIIALTASATKDDQEQCFADGMNDYCTKPVEPAVLTKTIRKWLLKNDVKAVSVFFMPFVFLLLPLFCGIASAELPEKQEQLAQRYAQLEQVLQRLAEASATSNPKNAALLKKVLTDSKDKLLTVRLQKIAEILQDKRLSDAAAEQETAEKDLLELLKILESADREQYRNREKENLKRILRDLENITQQEQILKEKTAKTDEQQNKKQQDKKQDAPAQNETLQKEQEKVRQQTEILREQIKNGISKNGIAENGAAGKDDSEKAPGEEAVERAVKRMQQAEQKLQKAEKSGAVEEQEDAVAALQKAKAELEKMLRQLREEERIQTLEKLEERFKRMLQIEQGIRSKTENLLQTQKGQSTQREQKIQADRLVADQQTVIEDADAALLLLKEDGTSKATAETLAQARFDMAEIKIRLEKIQVDTLTQQIENDVIQALTDLIDAVRLAKEEAKKKQKNSKEPPEGQAQASADDRLIQLLSELRMIRTMQHRINDRTVLCEKEVERLLNLNPGSASSDSASQEERERLKRQTEELARQQSRISRILHDLQVGKAK